MKSFRSVVSFKHCGLAVAVCIAVLFWLLQSRQLIISDAANYALLGESIWTSGAYLLHGEPYAKHLPLHPLISYPLISMFGYSAGLKLSSLFAGLAVLCFTYAVAARAWSVQVAAATVLLTAIHHNFVFMIANGYADMLFTALFLLFLLAYARAAEDRRWYVVAGTAVGLASLTRYNGVPLFIAYAFYALIKRRSDIRSREFVIGLLIGCGLFSLWLLRNAITFGDPLATRYTGELNPDYLEQLLVNIKFYFNPLHNILPVLLPFCAYGIFKTGKKNLFLLVGMASALALTSVWTTLSMRFAFPVFPLMLGFAVAGMYEASSSVPETWRKTCGICLILVIAATHLGAVCLYSLGSCNAWFDRTFAFLPKDLHLSQEGQHAWEEARSYVRSIARSGETVYVYDPAHAAVYGGAFGDGVGVTNDTKICPVYEILSEKTDAMQTILFESSSHPKRYVTVRRCDQVF